MLGHPGISAFAYAGAAERYNHEEKMKEREAEQKLIKRAFGRDSTTSAELGRDADASQPVVSSDTSELQQPHDDYAIAQRRRGTFINHTPRNHEVRLSSKLSHRHASSEDLNRLYASYRGSSDENTNTSASHSVQHSSYGSFTADQSTKLRGNAPVGLDNKETALNPLPAKIMHPTSTFLPRQRRSQSSSAAASIKSSQTGISKRSLRNFLSGNTSLDAAIHHESASFDETQPSTPTRKPSQRLETANSKRRRRQTPYMIPKPLVTDVGRHAPLEPLVAHHRREVTGSDVDPLPPHVDISNHVDEAATLLAINEYFDSQKAPLTVDQSPELASRNKQAAPEEPSAQALPSLTLPPSSKEDAPPIEILNDPKESTPSLPERNPERLSRINSPITLRRTKSISELSVQSDFTSAAKGHYSPYDERFDTVPKMLRRPAPVPPPVYGRSTSSTSGKLAPRIPGHDELESSRLNDFNYFLRMTGPSPPHEAKIVPKKKIKGLRVMKVRSRKEAKNGVGRDPPNEPPPPLPACAREMITSSGAKHLQIMIPAAGVDVAPNQTVCLPVFDALGRSRRVSVTWTDEMLQPLASSEVERAINGTEHPPTTPTTPLRSPKPAAVSPEAVPVDDHPLLVNRKERTRSRKLRDLKRAKGKMDIVGEEGVGSVEDKVTRLEWLVGELAQGLARSAGMEWGLGPEEVLQVWRGMVMRGG